MHRPAEGWPSTEKWLVAERGLNLLERPSASPGKRPMTFPSLRAARVLGNVVGWPDSIIRAQRPTNQRNSEIAGVVEPASKAALRSNP